MAVLEDRIFERLLESRQHADTLPDPIRDFPVISAAIFSRGYSPLGRLLVFHLVVPLDLRTKRAQAFVYTFVPSLYLAYVVDTAGSLGTQCRDQEGHPGTDVRTFQLTPPQGCRSHDHRTVWVTQYDAGPHPDQLVGEEHAGLEHLFMY